MAAVKLYARSTPEAPKGFPVFVAVLTDVIMAADHMGGPRARQRLLGPFIR
jgi:hypothetical protein